MTRFHIGKSLEASGKFHIGAYGGGSREYLILVVGCYQSGNNGVLKIASKEIWGSATYPSSLEANNAVTADIPMGAPVVSNYYFRHFKD